jgi:5'-methylthioinosine phosphorylase
VTAATFGIIAGSGFAAFDVEVLEQTRVETPYGLPSSPLLRVGFAGRELLCIARHGLDHTIAPHEVNYRANVWALRAAGASVCIGLNWVGGIARALGPGELAVPEQLIDYTQGRTSTFGATNGRVRHIDFTLPFDPVLRGALALAVHETGFEVHGGVYGVMQGPRLETAAEIDRLERDGCTIVGMTAMPEAALAREAGLRYAILAAIVNHAAGRTSERLHAQMAAVTDLVAQRQRSVLGTLLGRLGAAEL